MMRGSFGSSLFPIAYVHTGSVRRPRGLPRPLRVRRHVSRTGEEFMDFNQAIKFGQLVNAAYAVAPSSTGPCGQSINAGGAAYTVVSSVFANDLATEMNPGRADNVASIGLVLQLTGGA